MKERKKTHLIYMDNEGHVWMQEHNIGKHHPEKAEFYSEVPSNDDKRWIDGKPSVVNQQFLTLSPFYPTQRLDVSVEIKRDPQLMNSNHPAFEGCVKYMKISSLDLRPIPKHIERSIYEIGVCHYGHKTAYRTTDIPADSKEEAMKKGYASLKPSIVESIIMVGVRPNDLYDQHYSKKPKIKP